MKTKTILLIVLAGIIVIVLMAGGWFVGINNRFIMLDQQVKSSWSQVENQLQRRSDLIPNLVQTVKGYAAHEEGIFVAVAEARAKIGSARTPSESMAANGELTSALSRLLMVVENYPQLKANENFLSLQSQLEGTENRISVERRRYNETVQMYNTSIKRIPDSIIASMRGFSEKPYFESDAAAKKVPTVSF